jgi:alkylated DNA repair protein alkB family protein 1
MPPQAICNVYKKYQKMSDASVDQDLDVVDFRRGLTDAQRERIVPADVVPSELIEEARVAFKLSGYDPAEGGDDAGALPEACTIYEHKDFPGE